MAVEAHLVGAGMGPRSSDRRTSTELLDETVEDTVYLPRFGPVGTVVGRRLDHVHRRSSPAGWVPSQAAAFDSSRRTFLPPVVMRTSLTTWAGAFFTVVSASHPLGSDSRMTLCQALATCLYSGAVW